MPAKPNASNLRVVIVNNFSGPSVGRYGMRALPLLKGLIAAGAKVGVVAAAGSGFAHAAIEAGADVTAISMSRYRAPQIIQAIRDAAWRTNANVITGTGYFTNLLVRLAAPAHAAVVNTSARMPQMSADYWGGALESSIRELVDAVGRDRSDAYVAISGAVAEGLIEMGIPEKSVVVIPNGIDADAFEKASYDFAGDMAGKLPTLDLTDRPLVFCAARNMDTTKGIDTLAEAAAILIEEWPADAPVPAPNFRVAGSGPEKALIRQFIAGEPELSERFQIVGYAPLIAPWYRACTVTVMPSRVEAAGVVALEAMSLSKPVVATRVGGIPEVVLDGETGILVDPDSPRALAEAIKTVLLDPELAQRLGEAGGRRVREHFTEKQMVDAYIELFTELTEGHV